MSDLAHSHNGDLERRQEEQALCWQYRRQGLELRDIAKLMTDKGFPMSHVTVKRRLEAHNVERFIPGQVEARLEMAEQFDYLYARTIAGGDRTLDGKLKGLHPRVAEVAANILEKKAKLLGLNLPVQVDLNISDTTSTAEDELGKLAAELGLDDFRIIDGELA